jgi:hypothetical protein
LAFTALRDEESSLEGEAEPSGRDGLQLGLRSGLANAYDVLDGCWQAHNAGLRKLRFRPAEEAVADGAAVTVAHTADPAGGTEQILIAHAREQSVAAKTLPEHRYGA